MSGARPTPRLLTAQQAAALLGLPYTTVRDLLLRGVLPRVEVPGLRRLLVDARQLDRMLESWRSPAPVGPTAIVPAPPRRARQRGRDKKSHTRTQPLETP